MTGLLVASNKNYPVPARTTRGFVNNRPPRQNIGHNSPHYERLMRRPPVLPGYDQSSEMTPKSHTIITIPTREERGSAHLSSGFSSVNSRCPPVGSCSWHAICAHMSVIQISAP
ncbi:hypothetical protein AVEN_208051-1 [Araneus ventricosus]|uniref:Uncharacterized protein n=1 Tax=Araneus ventricosus TaxID=182803 RepID=A0A4Y2F0H0_ARAVE|nr:hypothetical protein AVEN_208051-1 [Araneus ventricosus]